VTHEARGFPCLQETRISTLGLDRQKCRRPCPCRSRLLPIFSRPLRTQRRPKDPKSSLLTTSPPISTWAFCSCFFTAAVTCVEAGEADAEDTLVKAAESVLSSNTVSRLFLPLMHITFTDSVRCCPCMVPSVHITGTSLNSLCTDLAPLRPLQHPPPWYTLSAELPPATPWLIQTSPPVLITPVY
jgi:hypothetical protein